MNLHLLQISLLFLSIATCAARVRGLRKHDKSMNLEDESLKNFRVLKGKKGNAAYADASPVSSPTASDASSPTHNSTREHDCNRKGKKGKGSGGKGCSKGSGNINGTVINNTIIVNPGPTLTVELEFVQLPPNATVPIATNVSSNTIGTVFVYNDVLLDYNLTVINGTFVTGVCTRTQTVLNLGGNNSVVGAGYCHYTYTISDGNRVVTFNAVGEVLDIFGGTLAITGGTGVLQGAYGEVQIVPTYTTDPPVNIDLFVDAVAYVGVATLFV